MKKKFWKLVNQTPSQATENPTAETVAPAERTLYLNGYIAEGGWYDDDVTPQLFKDELNSGEGNLTVWINSGGGDCIAAAQIYNMLREYSNSKGKVTVKIDGLAASAASVIAMAGDKVYVSPLSLLMIHNPTTVAFGETGDMEKAIAMLGEVKESIINAYELKTGLSRTVLSHYMDGETWMNAKKAIELGFADAMLGGEAVSNAVKDMAAVMYTRPKSSETEQLAQMLVSLRDAVQFAASRPQSSILTEKEPVGRSVKELSDRLDLLKQLF